MSKQYLCGFRIYDIKGWEKKPHTQREHNEILPAYFRHILPFGNKKVGVKLPVLHWKITYLKPAGEISKQPRVWIPSAKKYNAPWIADQQVKANNVL